MTDLSSLSEAEYHRHPALSASGAKVLLREGGPAKYRWMMDHEPELKTEFDIGHAVHGRALGVGADMVAVAGNRNSKDVKAAIAEVRAAGKIPLHPEQYQMVEDMVAALRDHDTIGPLLARADRCVEQRVSWTDPIGVPWRGMLDLQIPGVIVDLKTAKDASPSGFSRAMGDYKYHLQAAVYQDAAAASGNHDVAFLLVAQEKTPPYLPAIYQPDADALEEGRRMMRRAAEIYRDCTESGIWPGYTAAPTLLSLPRYYSYTEDAA